MPVNFGLLSPKINAHNVRRPVQAVHVVRIQRGRPHLHQHLVVFWCLCALFQMQHFSAAVFAVRDGLHRVLWWSDVTPLAVIVRYQVCDNQRQFSQCKRANFRVGHLSPGDGGHKFGGLFADCRLSKLNWDPERTTLTISALLLVGEMDLFHFDLNSTLRHESPTLAWKVSCHPVQLW